jgi:hypothetical protein
MDDIINALITYSGSCGRGDGGGGDDDDKRCDHKLPMMQMLAKNKY